MDELDLQIWRNIRDNALLLAGTQCFLEPFQTGCLLRALLSSEIPMTRAIDFFTQRCLTWPSRVTYIVKHFDMDFDYFLFQGSFQKTKSKVSLEEASQLLKASVIDFSKLLYFVLESFLLPYSFLFGASSKGSSSSFQAHSCSSQCLGFSKGLWSTSLPHSFPCQV